ncbi:MAG: hypothetical protein MZV63_63495 [Marinilabiliales bacterium]|nr:hypothetical protein [Marinilabiliales bacterium]
MVSRKLDTILQEMSSGIPKWVNRQDLKKEMLDEVVGLGPLSSDFLRDEAVSEIMVISRDRIPVEKKGKITESEKRFSSNEALMAIIERIVLLPSGSGSTSLPSTGRCEAQGWVPCQCD